MSKQAINVGSTANDNTGSTLRAGGQIINSNFDELYASIGNGSSTQLSVSSPALNQVLKFTGSQFEPADLGTLTSSLDVNGNSIISASNGDITINPNGTGDIILSYGTATATFDGGTNILDVSGVLQYKNEFSTIGAAPAAATYPGYYYTVDGDDNPYVNINITAGGTGDVRAKLITEYSSVNLLSDIDTTTTAPTNGQVLKWSTSGGKWLPADDDSGLSSVNVFQTLNADTGSVTADSQSDSVTFTGGTDITTTISGDVITIAFSGTIPTTFAALSDSDMSGTAQFGNPTQGDSLFWNGSDWIVTRSPMVWWEVNANGTSDFTFNGPGFSSTANDPDLYVYRGFTYAFDNSIQGGAHPFRIQSTQGLAGNPYTAGQSGSGTNVLYWTVPLDAPNTLYYQCTIHAAMQGSINVVS